MSKKKARSKAGAHGFLFHAMTWNLPLPFRSSVIAIMIMKARGLDSSSELIGHNYGELLARTNFYVGK